MESDAMNEPEPEPPADREPPPETTRPAGDAEGCPQRTDDPTRRSFLGLCTLGIGVCAGAGVLGAVSRTVLGAPDGEGSARWVDVGALTGFAEGVATKVPAVGERRDAWSRYEPRGLGSVIVVREGDGARAFSSVCPHNGCAVFVSDAALVCPCHDSRFALDGRLESGKSPRGLDPLEVRVTDGRVSVRYQRFEVGTPERKPI